MYYNRYNEGLTKLPRIPDGVTNINIWSNKLTKLPKVPNTTENINARDNQLKSLSSLPPGLKYLDVTKNQLKSLPSLPLGLTFLKAGSNQLKSLPPLPPGLTYLNVTGNQLRSLPSLPQGLEELQIGNNNNLTRLPPVLPSSLRIVGIINTGITDLTPLIDLKSINPNVTIYGADIQSPQQPKFHSVDINNIPEDNTGCSICLEEFNNGNTVVKFAHGKSHIGADHIFHEDCLVEWLNRENICPFCRGVACSFGRRTGRCHHLVGDPMVYVWKYRKGK